MEMHGSDQTILKVVLCGRDFLTLLTKTLLQIDEREGVMGKHTTSTANLRRFVLPTKLIVSMTTNVDEVCYTSSTALFLLTGLAQSQ